jgi:hypothetical protein
MAQVNAGSYALSASKDEDFAVPFAAGNNPFVAGSRGT